MLLDINSPNPLKRFVDPAFNPADPFQPMSPSDELLDNALLDPGLVLGNLAIPPHKLAVAIADRSLRNLLRQQQYIVYEIASRAGVLAPFLDVTRSSLRAFDTIVSSLNALKVRDEALTTAIGIAGKALSAVPNIYTQIAAAIIQFGAWLGGAWADSQGVAPTGKIPTQEYSRDTDTSQFNDAVRSVMRAGLDWNPIFMPRFKGDLSMQVRVDEQERNVLAWALGDGKVPRVTNDNSFTADGTFIEGGGLGFIPGGQLIYSVIQQTTLEAPVGYTSDHPTLYDPRCGSSGKVSTIDVGTFYPVTSQGCASLWQFIFQRGASLYTLNALELSEQWNDYFDSIWAGVDRYWHEIPWQGKGNHTIGWGCGLWENALQDLVGNYTVGLNGQINLLSWRPMREGKLKDKDYDSWNESNAARNVIFPALNKLLTAQLWYLDNTTLAAYLPFEGGVDADPLNQPNVLGSMRSKSMREHAVKARRRILESSQKYEVRLEDVLDPVYRDQIEKAGGGTKNHMGLTAAPAVGVEVAPPTGGLGLPIPGGSLVGPGPRARRSNIMLGVATAAGLASIAGLMFWFSDDVRRTITATRSRLRRRSKRG